MRKNLKYKPSAISFQHSAISSFLSTINHQLSTILCLVSCVLYLASYGSDTTKVKAFSLKQAQDFAIENNYQTKNAATDIEKSKKMVKQTTAIGFPQINASASYQDFIDIPTQLIPGEFFGKEKGTFIPVKFLLTLPMI